MRHHSVLESDYIPPTRPYSQKELQDMRQKMFDRLHIGTQMIKHPDTGYFYYAKKGGRKERESKEHNSENIGNCSVTWKLSRTPNSLKHIAQNMVDEYCESFKDTPKRLTYYLVDLECVFYTWLYEEFNQSRKHRG